MHQNREKMSIHITYTYRKMKITQNQKFTILPISHWRDLNPRPADYKSAALPTKPQWR